MRLWSQSFNLATHMRTNNAPHGRLKNIIEPYPHIITAKQPGIRRSPHSQVRFSSEIHGKAITRPRGENKKSRLIMLNFTSLGVVIYP